MIYEAFLPYLGPSLCDTYVIDDTYVTFCDTYKNQMIHSYLQFLGPFLFSFYDTYVINDGDDDDDDDDGEEEDEEEDDDDDDYPACPLPGNSSALS